MVDYRTFKMQGISPQVSVLSVKMHLTFLTCNIIISALFTPEERSPLSLCVRGVGPNRHAAADTEICRGRSVQRVQRHSTRLNVEKACLPLVLWRKRVDTSRVVCPNSRPKGVIFNWRNAQLETSLTHSSVAPITSNVITSGAQRWEKYSDLVVK